MADVHAPARDTGPGHGLAASVTGVVRIYRTTSGEVHALKGVDAAFPTGEVTAVVGPSGSGKSSLLRILACMDRPTAGRVRVGGVDVSAMTTRQRREVRRDLLGYVFQRPSENLLPYLTAADHVRLGARLRGRGRRDVAPGGHDGHGSGDGGDDDLLAALGLDHRRRHRAATLSGGEQQRLAFAAAVVGRPALVVADEPTAELDSGSGRLLMDAVHALVARGTSFVVSTHDPVVIDAADRVLHLRHGSLEAESGSAGLLQVIDADGRVQLPAEAVELFADRRAVVRVEDGEVRITPP